MPSKANDNLLAQEGFHQKCHPEKWLQDLGVHAEFLSHCYSREDPHGKDNSAVQ